MLVKVLDNDRVKILMEDQDIAFYDLPFEKLSEEDPDSQAFIYELIQKTQERTGIDFKDCKVMIEVVPGVSGSYYILLTRMREEGEGKICFDKADLAEREVYIFRINHAWDIPSFFELMSGFSPEESSLYFFGESYYALLAFNPSIIKNSDFNFFLLSLEEFADRCRYQYINEALLMEWGECICERGAHEKLKSKGTLEMKKEM